MAYTTIDKSTDYFETILYTGNGSSLDVSGLDFSPGWVWMKKRSNAANSMVYDTVRGVKKHLHTNTSDVEVSEADDDIGLNSFNSDGFTVKVNGNTNTNTHTYAAWNWKTGTTFTNDASSTGVGNLDSAGSVSDTSGLSVVTYSGGTGSAATIKHGLSSAPKMMWVKPLSGSGVWLVYHKDLPIKGQLQLQSSDAAYSHSGNIYWNGTHPTSSVFSIGTSGAVNASENYVVYCFADVKGYSKIGSYTGNNDADGIFVYTGFKPAWVLVKNTTGNNWGIIDNKRDPSNGMQTRLHPNLSNADNTGAGVVVDFLSNGFKCRNNDGLENGAADIIYMAFAESPFVNSNGVPNNAR